MGCALEFSTNFRGDTGLPLEAPKAGFVASSVAQLEVIASLTRVTNDAQAPLEWISTVAKLAPTEFIQGLRRDAPLPFEVSGAVASQPVVEDSFTPLEFAVRPLRSSLAWLEILDRVVNDQLSWNEFTYLRTQADAAVALELGLTNRVDPFAPVETVSSAHGVQLDVPPQLEWLARWVRDERPLAEMATLWRADITPAQAEALTRQSRDLGAPSEQLAVKSADQAAPAEALANFTVAADARSPLEALGLHLLVVPSASPLELLANFTVLRDVRAPIENAGVVSVVVDSGSQTESRSLLLVDSAAWAEAQRGASWDTSLPVESVSGVVMAVAHTTSWVEVLALARADTQLPLASAVTFVADAVALAEVITRARTADSTSPLEMSGAPQISAGVAAALEWALTARSDATTPVESLSAALRATTARLEAIRGPLTTDRIAAFEALGATSLDQRANVLEALGPLALDLWARLEAAARLLADGQAPVELVLGTMRLSSDAWAQIEARFEPPLLEVPLGGLLASPGRVWVLASPGNLQPERGP